MSTDASTSSTPTPVEPATIENVTDDGLLQKKILTEGNGDPAGRGSKVTINYSLYKSSQTEQQDEGETSLPLIDSSGDKPLTFTQGRKKVIPALDAVVETMSLGEKSRVYADAAYAFGRKGLRRKNINPNTNVELDVEMLSFEGGEKRKPLSDMSPRELFEQALKHKESGNALFKQVKFEKAMLQYSQCIRYASNVFYKPKAKKTQEPQEPQEQPQDENEKPSASETTEATSDQNGSATAEENGFNEAAIIEDEEQGQPIEQGTKSVNQTGTDKEDEDEEHEEEEKQEEKQEKEEEEEEEEEEEIVTVDATAGGVVVNESDSGQTGLVGEYDANDENESDSAQEGATTPDANEEAVPVPETENAENAEEEEEEEENDDPEEEEVKILKVTALNNLSLCLVKLDDFKQAVESATAALQLDPDNSKGHYYRGRALVALGEWEKAREDLVKAAKLQPNNMGIRMEITKLDKKRKSFQNLERKQAAAMFA